MVICPLLSKTQCLSIETIAVYLRYRDTIESDSMQRQIWSSALICQRLNVFRLRLLQSPVTVQRQARLIACRYKYSHLLLWSKTQCLSSGTIVVSLYHQETTKSDGMQTLIWSSAPFVKNSVSLVRGYCSLPLLSRDNRFQQHVETNMVICPLLSKTQCLSTETIAVSLCYPEIIVLDQVA